MTRHASPGELVLLAEGVLGHRKSARVGSYMARSARRTRVRQAQGDQNRSVHGRAHPALLRPLGGPAQARRRRIDATAGASALSGPGRASQPSAAARGEGLPDAELLRRHVAGDGDAFGELFGRHRDWLWAIAVRAISDPEEAADAVQDAMIAAFLKADNFRGDSAVTTWLHRIVVNAALDRMRRRATRPTTACPDEEALDALATGGQPRADPSECSDTAIDVRAALRQLAPDQQSALVLVDMLGYSVADAAQVLGVSEGTVKSRTARGRVRLRPRLAHLRPRALPKKDRRNQPAARRLLPTLGT